MRPALNTLILTSLLPIVACTGDESMPSPPSSSFAPPSPASSVTPSSGVSPTPTMTPDILPPGVPATYDRDVAPEQLPREELVPEGALTDDLQILEGGPVAITWVLGVDPLRSEHGLVIWRRRPGENPPWVATYAIREPPSAGVLGIRMTRTDQDLTGDGQADILFLEGLGGSGACAIWGVVQLTPQHDDRIFRRQLCDANVDPLLTEPGIRIQASVYRPGDPHCCPSEERRTDLAWTDSRWRTLSTEVTDLSG